MNDGVNVDGNILRLAAGKEMVLTINLLMIKAGDGKGVITIENGRGPDFNLVIDIRQGLADNIV